MPPHPKNSPALDLLDSVLCLYQKTISPDHGPLQSMFPAGVCRHCPTCSQYARQAIHLHRWRGVSLSLRRLLSCHPFSHRSYYDPVKKIPNHTSKNV